MRKRVSLLLAICSTNVFDYRLFVCFHEGFNFIYTLIKCIEKENHHISLEVQTCVLFYA